MAPSVAPPAATPAPVTQPTPPPAPPLLPGRPILNRALQNLMMLILRDFLYGWYHDITDDTDLGTEVQRVLGAVLREVEQRSHRVAWSDFLVIRVSALVKAHYRDYRQCMAKVGTVYGGAGGASTGMPTAHHPSSGTGRRDGQAAVEANGRTAADVFHALQSHPALDRPLTELRYFRRLTDRLLPLLLPREDRDTPSVRYLVREIVTNVVWRALVDSLSDPSTLHALIVELALDYLGTAAAATSTPLAPTPVPRTRGGFRPAPPPGGPLGLAGSLRSATALEAWRKRYPAQWATLRHRNPWSAAAANGTSSANHGLAAQHGAPTLRNVSPYAAVSLVSVEDQLREAQSTSIQGRRTAAPPVAFHPNGPAGRPSSDLLEPAPTVTTTQSGEAAEPEVAPLAETPPSPALPPARWQPARTAYRTTMRTLSLIAYISYLLLYLVWSTVARFFATYTFAVASPLPAGNRGAAPTPRAGQKSTNPSASTWRTPVTYPSRYYLSHLVDLASECLCLNTRYGWLTAHVVYYVVPLAETLAGVALDKVVRDQVEGGLGEIKLAGYIADFQRALWPDGQLVRNRPPKSVRERQALRRDAEVLLDAVLPGALRNLGAPANEVRFTARLLLDPLHSQAINRHLLLNTIDLLVGTLFPELAGSRSAAAMASGAEL